MFHRLRFGWTVLIAASVAVPAVANAQRCDPCVIGVVLDGPWQRNAEIQAVFEEEILDLTRGTVGVEFPPSKRRIGDFSFSGIAAEIDTLMADPEVDLVMTVSPVASTYAGRLSAYPKPVVAAFVLDPVVQGLPGETDSAGRLVSGVHNLSYVTFPAYVDEHIERLREIAPFDHLTFLTNEAIGDAVPELAANFLARFEGSDLDVLNVPVGTSADDALGAIPEHTDAVYVYPLVQLRPEDFDQIVKTLIERGLPGFSFWGQEEVEMGLFASIFPGEAFDRLGRRVALNIQRILMGEDAGTLPVSFERRIRISLNVETARAIGIYPSWSVWTEVELVGDRQVQVERELTLARAVQEAVDANLDLMARATFVAARQENTRIARSALYPQLSISGAGQFIDTDRAASFSAGPQRLGTVSATVTQLLYADSTLANIEIEDQLQLSRAQQLEELRLDIVGQTAVAYLDVLRAKRLELIQRDNLAVTRSNLELAQIRQTLGVARAAEVIRWEAQIANNRRDVIRAGADRNLAELQVNRLLSRPLEEPFRTVETDLNDPALQTSASRLSVYLDDPFSFDLFRSFMSSEALARSPELQQIDADIRGQERALTASQRSFWAPTVTFTGEVSGVGTGGAGSGGALGLSSSAIPDALNWTTSVSATLPLFTGGSRRAERTQASLDLEELRLRRRSVALDVEQRVRSALHLAGASYAAIELAEAAADASERNLELVTDAYERGAAAIIDLLDAQNEALVAREVAASAVFDYLIDLMDVQRGVGRFDFFTSPAEYQEFIDRLNRTFAASGLRVQ